MMPDDPERLCEIYLAIVEACLHQAAPSPARGSRALQAEFGQRLRTLRDDRRISARGLAKQIGVSAVTIWKWEKGQAIPRPRSLGAVADALGISGSSLQSPRAIESHRMPLKVDLADDIKAKTASHGHAELRSASPGQSAQISAAIAKAKQMISEAAGVRASKVTVQIRY